MMLKKFALILTASAVILSSALSFSVFAEETESSAETSGDEIVLEDEDTITSEDGTYEYTVAEDDDGSQYAVLETYLGNDIDIIIPSEIDGIKVQQIGDYTYYEDTTVKTITVPASVEDFGKFSFYGCTSLTEFIVDDENEIYKAVDGILYGRDDLAIFCCPPGKKLTSYTVPDTVVAIAPSAFAVCVDLESIELPDSLEYISIYAFSECEKLDNVVIPESVEELDDFVFSGCTSLSSITFPDTLTTIGNATFYKCESLVEIEFPPTLYSVGQGAFVSTGFDSIEIPDTLYDIGYSAFGFYTDQAGEITPVSGFVIRGYAGTYAQSYCSENNITFEEIAETTEAVGENTQPKIKPGVVIAIVVAALAVIIIVIIIIYKCKHTDYEEDEHDIGDYDDYDDKESDNGENESNDTQADENEENNDEA